MAVPSDDRLRSIFGNNADRSLEIEDEDAGGCDDCGCQGTESGGMDFAGFRRAVAELLLAQAQGS